MSSCTWTPDEDPGTAIILAEDKKYYPTAEETYGPGTETLVMEEDAQPLETPIIAPVVGKKHEKLLAAPLATHYSNEFLAALSSNPDLIRNVAVSGTWQPQQQSRLVVMMRQQYSSQYVLLLQTLYKL
jgi:U5 small nuclear ribonucleoprotein component